MSNILPRYSRTENSEEGCGVYVATRIESAKLRGRVTRHVGKFIDRQGAATPVPTRSRHYHLKYSPCLWTDQCPRKKRPLLSLLFPPFQNPWNFFFTGWLSSPIETVPRWILQRARGYISSSSRAAAEIQWGVAGEGVNRAAASRFDIVAMFG